MKFYKPCILLIGLFLLSGCGSDKLSGRTELNCIINHPTYYEEIVIISDDEKRYIELFSTKLKNTRCAIETITKDAYLADCLNDSGIESSFKVDRNNLEISVVEQTSPAHINKFVITCDKA